MTETQNEKSRLESKQEALEELMGEYQEFVEESNQIDNKYRTAILELRGQVALLKEMEEEENEKE